MEKASMSAVRATRTIRAIGSATPRSFRLIGAALIRVSGGSRSREVVPDSGAVALAQVERCDFARLQPHAQPPRALPGDLVRQHVGPRRNLFELEAAVVVGSQ